MVLIDLYRLSDTHIPNTCRSDVTEQKSVLNTEDGSDGLIMSVLRASLAFLAYIYLSALFIQSLISKE